mgnify:FL=1
MIQKKHFIGAFIMAAAFAGYTFNGYADNGLVTYSANTGTKEVKYFGTAKKESFDVAMLLADKYTKGKKIETIKVPFPKNAEIGNVKIWLTKKLTLENKKNVADVMSLDATMDDSTAIVKFATPYTIDSDTLYIGYSFDVVELTERTQLPISLINEKGVQGLWTHSSRTYRSWLDKSTYGCSAMQVELSGFNANDAYFEGFKDYYNQVNIATPINLTLLNRGYNGIKSIDYSYSVGDKKVSDHLTLEAPIPACLNASTEFTVTLPAIEAKGKYPVTFSIDKVNGEANSEVATANSTMAIYNKLPKHRPVMEEFTGTWCGNCARGWIGLEVMTRLHPDFIALAYHSGDVMQVIDQKNFLGFDTENPAYPMANIDRVYTDIDPYYGADMTPFGIEEIWKKQAEILAPASLETEAAFTPDGKDIKAKAILEFPEDANDADKYSVEFVLVTDGLHGEGQAWEQSNYLEENEKGDYPFPEADIFFAGSSSIPNMHYNDVVVATTRLRNGLIKLPAKVEAEKAFSIEGTITEVDSIKNMANYPVIQDSKNLRIVALLLNEKGEIVNGAQAKVTGYETTGIRNINNNAAEADVPAIYNLQGHRLQTMQKGLNIIRTKDGKTKKVMR